VKVEVHEFWISALVMTIQLLVTFAFSAEEELPVLTRRGWVFLRAGLDVTQVLSSSACRSLNSTVTRTLVRNALY